MTYVIMRANSVNQDQTAPVGAVLGLHCLKANKNISADTRSRHSAWQLLIYTAPSHFNLCIHKR